MSSTTHAVSCLPACSWPDIIGELQGFWSAATGADGATGYAPSCFFPQAESAEQAYVNVLEGLITPGIVVVVCMCVWAVR